MNTHENNQNDTNDQHERREEEDNNSEEKTASNTTETRSIFTGSNHTYSDHSSSDEDEDFASVGDIKSGHEILHRQKTIKSLTAKRAIITNREIPYRNFLGRTDTWRKF